jgi:Protein of unknown function (DUF1566)
MPKISQTTLICLMALLPMVGTAQTCNPAVTATSPTGRFTSNADGTALDKYTGLIWKTCSEGQQWIVSTRACNKVAGTYTWQAALQGVQVLNSKGGFAKYKDWRVPSIKELSSLVETQCYRPAINARAFPGVGAVTWSSSPDANDSKNAWSIDFGDGSVYTFSGKSASYQVRLVRGGQ